VLSQSFISLSLFYLFFFSLSEEFFFPRNNFTHRKKKKRERWRKSPWKKKKKKKNRDACGRRHRRILLRSTGEICFSISKYSSSAMRCAILKNSLMIYVEHIARDVHFSSMRRSFERKHIEMRFFMVFAGEARARLLSSSVLFLSLSLSLSLSQCFAFFLCLCAGGEMNPLSLSLSAGCY